MTFMQWSGNYGLSETITEMGGPSTDRLLYESYYTGARPSIDRYLKFSSPLRRVHVKVGDWVIFDQNRFYQDLRYLSDYTGYVHPGG